MTFVTRNTRPSLWKRWMDQPQRIWLRRALFQVHLWCGLAIGLYILMVSVTGSVLVYRNELFRMSPAMLRATSWLLDLHDNLLAGETDKQWEQAVADNIRIGRSRIEALRGWHVVRLWLVDPGVVFQRLVLARGALPHLYLGPPESRRMHQEGPR